MENYDKSNPKLKSDSLEHWILLSFGIVPSFDFRASNYSFTLGGPCAFA
jgi:hypothetical protein